MHPIFAHRSRLGAYLLAWTVPAILVGLLLATVGGQPWWELALIAAPLTLVLAFICLAAWYPCRAFPLQRHSILALIPVHLLGAALAATLWWWIPGSLWVEALRGAGLDAAGTWKAATNLCLLAAFLLYLISVVVHYLLAEVERSRRAENRSQELRVLAKEAELQALRAQVDPHFLFNSLNSVAALAGAAPVEARRMCERLGNFLRHTLEYGDRTQLPFAQELELACEYLQIEKVRFQDRLELQLDLAPEAQEIAVPALLLQPLVENAIRHGIAHLVEGGSVHIQTRCRNSVLEVKIDNPVDAERPAASGSGRGLANLRRRLAAQYGGRAALTTTERDGRFVATLRLPTEESAG